MCAIKNPIKIFLLFLVIFCVSAFADANYKKFDFIEKTFIPIDKNNHMQITEFRQNNEYLPKIIIFGDKKKSIIDEEEEKSKSKGKYFEEGFDSVESRNIKVFISNKSVQSEDSNSIVPSSSNDEIFV